MKPPLCTFAEIETGRHRCTRCGFEVRTQTLPIVSTCQTLRLDASPCIHLGKHLGSVPCIGCRNNTVLKSAYECHHPAKAEKGGQTTLHGCNRCPLYEPATTLGARSRRTPTTPGAAVPPKSRFKAVRQKLLIRMLAGLGDAVQLTPVLRHLRELHPQWEVDVLVSVGQASLFAGLCHTAHEHEPPRTYDQVRTLHVRDPDCCYVDSPSTKAEKWLREIFDITPRPKWCHYEIRPDDRTQAKALRYAAEELQHRPFVLIHYQGNSWRSYKNIGEQTMAATVRRIQQAGRVPVLLDWDGRSALLRSTTAAVDERTRLQNPGAHHWLWDGHSYGDGATIAALAARAELCLGIDSGPGHCFAATATPTIIVMDRMHPLHYFAPSETVLHLVPARHENALQAKHARAGAAWFVRHYRSHVMRGNVRDELPEVVAGILHRRG